MEGTSKDLLQFERKEASASAIESALLVCKNKEPSSLSAAPPTDKKPVITSVPKSLVRGKVRDFLGVFAEANKKLELRSKDNAEAYDIEALTGNESEVIEMDLMLGVADLNTPEAVAAAEAAISGSQSVIRLAGGDDYTESEDGSDDSDEENTCPMETTTTEMGKDKSSREAAEKEGSKKRAKIVELS